MAGQFDGITIWRSEVVEQAAVLRDRDRLQYYDAIFAYAFDGVEPEFTGKQAALLKAFWATTKHQLDVSIKKQEAGREGGRRSASKREAERKQSASRAQPNSNSNSNSSKSPQPPFGKGGGEGATWKEVGDDPFGACRTDGQMAKPDSHARGIQGTR